MLAELKTRTGASALTDGLGARLVCDVHDDRKSERNAVIDIGSSIARLELREIA